MTWHNLRYENQNLHKAIYIISILQWKGNVTLFTSAWYI